MRASDAAHACRPIADDDQVRRDEAFTFAKLLGGRTGVAASAVRSAVRDASQ